MSKKLILLSAISIFTNLFLSGTLHAMEEFEKEAQVNAYQAHRPPEEKDVVNRAPVPVREEKVNVNSPQVLVTEEKVDIPSATELVMRELLKIKEFDWTKVSPQNQEMMLTALGTAQKSLSSQFELLAKEEATKEKVSKEAVATKTPVFCEIYKGKTTFELHANECDEGGLTEKGLASRYDRSGSCFVCRHIFPPHLQDKRYLGFEGRESTKMPPELVEILEYIKTNPNLKQHIWVKEDENLWSYGERKRYYDRGVLIRLQRYDCANQDKIALTSLRFARELAQEPETDYSYLFKKGL